MLPQPLLLIVGGESDPQTQRVVDQAHLRNVRYHFLDTDQADAERIAWDFDSARIDLHQTVLHPTAVFMRYNVFTHAPARDLAIFETILSYTLAWTELKILNRSAVSDANNKSRNLRWARDAGLAVPRTLVMADLTPLATMPDADSQIIKPLSGGEHTRAVSEVRVDTDYLAHLPPQFVQNRLRGENLRLFWIGGQPFCFHVQSTALDYRTDAHVGVARIEPPRELLAPTGQLVERIGFDYCALDFRCVAGFDRPVFLEINSFPMFVRFDDAAGNALVDAILSLLMKT
jgi:glutathione synthase/RimK-type ligase-like ATP-grasp enzyme